MKTIPVGGGETQSSEAAGQRTKGHMARICVFAAVVLLLAAGANMLAGLRNQRAAHDLAPKEAMLATKLASNRHAIRVDDLPTDFVREFIGANEVFNRRFHDGRVTFEVYVAFWRSGEASLLHAYGHIPDICWTNTGWECIDGASQLSYQFGGTPFRPAEWRRFRAPGQEQEVIYWCVIGGSLYPFKFDPSQIGQRFDRVQREMREREERKGTLRGLIAESDFLRFWWDRYFAREKSGDEDRLVRENTFFIRVNSPWSIKELGQNPMFIETMEQLAQLGIAPANGVPSRPADPGE